MLTGCFWRKDQSFFSPLTEGKKSPEKVPWDELAQHHRSAGWISHTTMKILFFTGLLSLTSSLCTTGESYFLYLFRILVNNVDFLIMLVLYQLQTWNELHMHVPITENSSKMSPCKQIFILSFQWHLTSRQSFSIKNFI